MIGITPQMLWAKTMLVSGLQGPDAPAREFYRMLEAYYLNNGLYDATTQALFEAGALGVATLPSYTYARFVIVGRTCTIVLNVDNVTIGGAAGSIKVSLPVNSAVTSTFWGNVARYLTADGYVPIRGVLTAGYVEVFKSISTTNYAGNETGYYLRVAGSYEI